MGLEEIYGIIERGHQISYNQLRGLPIVPLNEAKPSKLSVTPSRQIEINQPDRSKLFPYQAHRQTRSKRYQSRLQGQLKAAVQKGYKGREAPQSFSGM